MCYAAHAGGGARGVETWATCEATRGGGQSVGKCLGEVLSRSAGFSTAASATRVAEVESCPRRNGTVEEDVFHDMETHDVI